MLLSKKWLSEFVTLPQDVSPKELLERVTVASVEVEGITNPAKNLAGVIVAEIREVLPHPNADKLRIAKVFDGKNELQIVCGAPNIAAGQKVPLAPIGTTLPAMGVTIEERAMRGEVSQGMLCASDELGIGTDHEGILILDPEAKVGMSVAELLGLDDWILEVDNKSMTHRPDMWSHFGFAREVAAIFDLPFAEPKIPEIKEGKQKITVQVENTEACPRYMAVKLEGVKIGPSPDWLVQRLEMVGMRSINSVVDATNYVMLELGQPLHAFDARQIADEHIVVRNAEQGEKLKLLDGQEVKLMPSDLVIADAQRILALAGIKGGLESGVTNDTTSIIIESANFDHIIIRKTSQRLGLRTDASARYEKSLDPNLTERALRRVVALLGEMSGGQVVSTVVDVSHFSLNQGPIVVTLEYLTKKIGMPLKAEEVSAILELLGFKLKVSKEVFTITIPTWRATKDVSGPHDIVEEVARIYGYANITPQLPTIQVVRPRVDYEKMLVEKSRDLLAYGFDMHEVYGYSFIAQKAVEQFGDDPERYIRVTNPQAEGLELLRRDLTPGLVLQNPANARMVDSCNLFELGLVFDKSAEGVFADASEKQRLPKQELRLAATIYGGGEVTPFYTAKNVAEILLRRFHYVPELIPQTLPYAWLHPERTLVISVRGEQVGIVSELAPALQKQLKLKHPVGILELNLTKLAQWYSDAREYVAIPKFPAIELDISMEIGRTTLWSAVEKAVLGMGNELIREVTLFDVYEGKGVAAGNKSIAFRVVYRSDDKTLSTAEADTVHAVVKKLMEKEFKAQIR